MSTHDTLRKAVAAKAAALGLELRLGYIGNLDRSRDDRSWTIWIQGIRDDRNGNLLSVGYVSTDELDRLQEVVDNGGIERKLQWAFNGGGTGHFSFQNVHNWNREVTMSAWEVEEALEGVLL